MATNSQEHHAKGLDDANPAIAKPATDMTYIRGFDGLRAIAVLFVLVAHAGFGNLVPGGFGVTVFFAISGYLITSLLMAEMFRTGTVNMGLFYARRLLRLYPELIVLILACLIIGPILQMQATIVEKLAGLFYYMNYYYVFGAHYTEAQSYPWRQLWSLAVEEHFYIFFPALLVFGAKTKRARIVALTFMIVAPLIWRLTAYHAVGLPWQYNYVATETRIDSIAWGCLLAVLLRANDGTPIVPQSLWFVQRWLVPAGIALILFTLLYRDESFRWTWRFTLQGIGLAILIGNVLFDPRWRPVVALLELPALRFVGRISYALYLYHILINRLIFEIEPKLSAVSLLAWSIALSLLAATTSYWLIETPLKSVRRRLGSHVR